MEFLILGPLEVRDRDHPVRLPGGKARLLLAHLLVHANERVSTDSLMDALWGDAPPDTADHAIEVYISRLRAVLDTDGRARLTARSGGYTLGVQPEELDAVRCDRLVRRGRDALTTHDAATAARLLRDAEALWRGPTLGELGSEPFALATVARLDELRRSALEDWYEAELALGNHAAVVGPLEAFVATEPLRERARGLSMVALYRSGRQAAALQTYHELRALLEEELGLDPAPELRELEMRILRQDPGLGAPARTTSGTGIDGWRSGSPERRLVTAAVVTLAGSPERDPAAGDDPERRGQAMLRLEQLVQAVLGPLGAVVAEHGQGSLVAVFGARPAQEDQVARAIDGAIALRGRVAAVDGAADPIRIGIETGEAIVSSIDGETSIRGTAIEHAARLAARAALGGVVVGPRAWPRVADRHTWSEPLVAGQDVVGGGPTGRELLSERPAPLRTRLGGRTFVGRVRELSALDSAYRDVVQRGEAGGVTVVADPGIGKSALLRRWLRSLGATGLDVTVLTGRCLAYGQDITYRPLADVLRSRLGISDADPPQVVEGRLRQAPILGLTIGLPAPGDLHPMAAQRRLHDAWVELLERIAAERPAILFIEDIHWAETPLLDLLERVIRDVTGPLLLITTARPDITQTRASWTAARRNVSTLWLDPLSEAESSAMLEALLPGGTSHALRAQLVERPEGNPFFLEELVGELRDRGLLVQGDQGWMLRGGDASVVLPDTVRAVLTARLDLLQPEARSALQAAAIVGRGFHRSSLRALLGRDPDLDELASRDLVRRLPVRARGSEEAYAFKHALIRDVALSSVPRAQRARLHARFAAHMEEVGGGRDEDAASLAHHYAAAADPEDADLAWADAPDDLVGLRTKARHWLRQAARLAVARYAIDEAVTALERCLALAPDATEAADVWLAIGRANVLRYDGLGFWDAMHHAREASVDVAARAAVQAELAFETAFRWAIWKQMPARELVDGWIDQALRLAGPGTRARAQALVADAYWHPLSAVEAPDEAIAIAERLDDPSLLSHALDARALVAFTAGDDRGAQAWWHRRTSLAPAITDLDHLEDLYGAAIAGDVALGRFGDARRHARLHDEVAMQLSSHHQVHAVAMLLELEELTGDWGSMLALTERTQHAVEANTLTPCVRNQRSLLSCALAAQVVGDAVAAASLEAAADALGMEGYDAVFAPLRTWLAITRGDMDEIRRRLPRAMPPPTKNWWRLTTLAARMDGLAALGATEQLERVAAPLLVSGTLLDAWARRAMARAHGDMAATVAAERVFMDLGGRPLGVTPSPGRAGDPAADGRR